MPVTFPKQRIEERPGIAVLSGPVEQLADIEAALLSRGFKSAPEPDLQHRQSHGLPSHPNPAAADEAGAPNAGHTPGTKHPTSGRVYKPDHGISFITLPLPEKPGRGRPVDEIADAIDPASGWRLRLHTTRSRHTVNVTDPDSQGVLARRELHALRKELGLPPLIAGGAPQNPAYTLQGGGGHPAELFRRAISTLIGGGGGGIEAGGSLGMTQNGTPNMSVNVAGGPGFGEVWVPGTTVLGQQGLYYCYNDGTENLAIVASDPTDPRIDAVIAQVEDSTYVGASDLWQLAVITGTPTPGANLSNLDGIASLPASSLRDGYVLVAAGATTIVTGDLAPVLLTFGPSNGFGVNLLRTNGSLFPEELGFGTDNFGHVVASAARDFVYTVPGALTYPTACSDAGVRGFAVYSDSGYTTEVQPGSIKLRAAPNANTIQITASNFYGFDVYPVVDVWGIGY